MTARQNERSIGDRALADAENDRLDFRSVAAPFAEALVEQNSDDGLVAGIIGKWGSGKSSLLFLVEDELRKLPIEKRPSVIPFRPWLIGNRDALIRDLFSSILQQIDQLAVDRGDASRAQVVQARKAAEAFRKFALGLGRTGSIIETSGDLLSFAPLVWLGRFLKGFTVGFGQKSPLPALEIQKRNLDNTLRKLNHKFFVTVDDLDRLDPSEAVEVLRLIKSVAYFPNVTYILCFDDEILAKSVSVGANVDDGMAYLEKLVQVSILVPEPEPFLLRNWFLEEIQTVGYTKNDDELSRLKSIVDHIGGRHLNSPRSVIRTVDSIRLFWPAISKAGADFADLVWLHLIKVSNSKLYRWIEEYCATAAILSLRLGAVSENEREKSLCKLIHIVDDGYFDDETYRFHFCEPLLGVEASLLKDGDIFSLFEKVPDSKRKKLTSEARLASPDHYRIYFSLSAPSYAIPNKKLDGFWLSAGTSSDAVGELILDLHSTAFSESLTLADLLLDRLRDYDFDSASVVQCKNVLLAFANYMDDAFYLKPFDHSWVFSIWDRARRLMPLLLSKLESAQRLEVLDAMFANGSSLGWLTNILRSETFAHGLYGERQEPESEWIASESELNELFSTMTNRYSGLSGEEFFSAVEPANMLYAWLQMGDVEGPKAAVQNYIKSDKGFLEVLECLMGLATSSSEGRYRTLRKGTIDTFMDYEAVVARLAALRSDASLAARVIAIEAAIAAAQTWD